MTIQEKIEYWDSLPENRLVGDNGLVDRKALIRHVAIQFGLPRLLEIGVDTGELLDHCHDVIGSYTGVDVSLQKVPDMESKRMCPYQYIESDSFYFWRSLGLTQEFDVVFIDGDHRSFPAYVDITQAMLRLSPSGYVICHDVSKSVPDEHGDDTTHDSSPRFCYNRIKNLSGWYSRILRHHMEGISIHFKTK